LAKDNQTIIFIQLLLVTGDKNGQARDGTIEGLGGIRGTAWIQLLNTPDSIQSSGQG
jgi:hypothetical protein